MQIRYYLPAILLSLFTVAPVLVEGQRKNATSASPEMSWLQPWMSAWELLVVHTFHISPGTAPTMVFFDDQYDYRSGKNYASTRTKLKGPRFFGRPLSWSRGRHNGQLVLPDSSTVPVGLMSFAAPLKDGSGFFVMAAPAYWKRAGLSSAELTQDQLITGVFLHEFSHSRQFAGFGRIIDSLEHSGISFPVDLSDDLVQDIFEKDTLYSNLFKDEVAAWYRAAFAHEMDSCRLYAKQALAMLKARQERWFTADSSWLKTVDDVFLSMEGLGQFAAVSWLVHPSGGRLPLARAVDGFRRKRNHWSQEEGLALMLVLNRLGKVHWARDFFSDHPVPVPILLEQALEDTPSK